MYLCVICSELFTGQHSENVCSTPCGHLYHYACLTDWFQRSKTCPQCRQKQSERKLIHINFSIPDHKTIEDNARWTNQRIASWSFRLMLKEYYLTEVKNKFLKQAGEECTTMRDELRSVESRSFAFQKTITHLKSELNEAKLEAGSLQDLLVLNKTEGRERQAEAKKLRDDISIPNRVNQELKDDVAYSEQDNNSLKRKVKKLENAIMSPGGNNPRDKALRRMIQKSPGPELLDSSFPVTPSSSGANTSDIPPSPGLSLRKRKHDLKMNIFQKSSRVLKRKNQQPIIPEVYNGLDGHSMSDYSLYSVHDKLKKLTKKKHLSASAAPVVKKRKIPIITLD